MGVVLLVFGDSGEEDFAEVGWGFSGHVAWEKGVDRDDCAVGVLAFFCVADEDEVRVGAELGGLADFAGDKVFYHFVVDVPYWAFSFVPGRVELKGELEGEVCEFGG